MNKRQRLLSAAAAATLGLAGLIGAAAPAASAATITVTDADCTSGITNAAPITGSPGDVIDITSNLAGCTEAFVHKDLVTGAGDISVTYSAAGTTTIALLAPVNVVYRVSTSGAGTITSFRVTLGNVNGTNQITLGDGSSNDVTWNVTISGSGGGGSTPSSGSSASAPAPVIQQFGMPTTGTCDEAQPEGLNLSGVPSGGWGISWAQWMNGGTGGAVCTRTLNYSTVQSKWVVN